MLAAVCNLARISRREVRRLALVVVLATGATVAAQAASADIVSVDASIGDTVVRLTAPPGQAPGVTPLAPIYLLHDVSGDGLEALAVFLTPETARFFTTRGQGLPAAGLTSTLIITERGLAKSYVDERALRDTLVDELEQQRRLQAFLASQRFGSDGLRVALPETRLLTVEDFLILEGRERLLPKSGRRISYCVEAFVALRNRPVLASSCLIKPDVSKADMYTLETAIGKWARQLLADNPSSRAPRPKPTEGGDLRPTAGSQPDPAVERLTVVNLRSAAEHRRTDVLVASALLLAQLPADLRAGFETSNERFRRNVASACGNARDAAVGYRCELIAFDRRLRALEQCTPGSIEPALQAESVEPAAGRLPNT